MKYYMENEGIKHEFTTVYTPAQNGVAERLNRTLMEKTRCILMESGVPLQFWAEALKTANVIRNHVSTKICGEKTPMELWTGRKPNIRYFRIFGCKVFARIPSPYWRGKLGQRAEQGVFMGYDENRKAALVWIQDRRQMVSSRDVQYMELEKGWENKTSHETDEEERVSIKVNISRDAIHKDEDRIRERNDEEDVTVYTIHPDEDGDTQDSRNDENEEEDQLNVSRYNLRKRTSKVKPDKYSLTASKGQKSTEREKENLDELIRKHGINAKYFIHNRQ
jgi:hypothetical protein